MTYRHLKKEEIDTLLSNNCVAEDWTSVTVTEGFSPENIKNTRFEGIVNWVFVREGLNWIITSSKLAEYMVVI